MYNFQVLINTNEFIPYDIEEILFWLNKDYNQDYSDCEEFKKILTQLYSKCH